MKKFLIIILSAILSIGANAQIVRAYSMLTNPSGPFISTSGSLTNFSTSTGTASTAQSFTFIGSSLTASVIWNGTAVMEVSSNGTTWASTATYSQSGGSASGTVFVRVKSSAASGSYSGNIAGTSAGASTVNVPFSANVSSIPSMSVSTNTITNLNAVSGTSGTAQTFNVTFANIAGSVTVNNFSPVEISQDGITYGASQSFSTGSPKTVYARVSSGASVGAISGNISVTAPGVAVQNIAVSGTVSAPSGKDSLRVQLDTLTANNQSGWTVLTGSPNLRILSATGGNANTITVSSVATANWAPVSTTCSAPNNGTTVGTVWNYAPNVMKESWFVYQSTYNSTKPQIKISGLKTDGTSYRIQMTGSLGHTFTGFLCGGDYRVLGNVLLPTQNFAGQTQPGDVENTSNSITFTTVVPDNTGAIYIYFNPTSGNNVAVLSAFILKEN